jgi:putative transcriptional regulator
MPGHPKRLPVAGQIRKGLEESVRHARGEITLKTTVVELPDPPPEIRPGELTKLRLDHRLPQDVFARVLNVPTRTVQAWEDGMRKPSQAALRLIQVFRQDPARILAIVGMTAAQVPASPKKPRSAARSKKHTSREVAP